MSVIIGLTGGIASGKSTVAKMFEEINIPVIDSDKIVRTLLDKGTEVYHKIVEHFTEIVLLPTGHINRKRLGEIIFNNERERKVLNYIVHPAVKKVILKRIAQYEMYDEKIIVIDVPLLFESKFDKLVNYSVLVYVDYDTQLKRLIDRDKINNEYAQKKINVQMELNEKKKLADFVINNGNTVLDTKHQFNKLIEIINRKVDG